MRKITDSLLKRFSSLADLVKAEHERQLAKWGIESALPAEWILWLTEEVGELAAAVGDFEYGRGGSLENVGDEAIQVATLALKIAEMYLFPGLCCGNCGGAKDCDRGWVDCKGLFWEE